MHYTIQVYRYLNGHHLFWDLDLSLARPKDETNLILWSLLLQLHEPACHDGVQLQYFQEVPDGEISRLQVSKVEV